MAETAALLGLPASFEFDSKTYPVAGFDFECEGLLERELEGRALAAVQRHRDRHSGAEYAAQLDGWRRDCAAGVYAYGEMESWKFLVSIKGRKYTAALRLSKGGKMAIDEACILVERIFASPDDWARLEAICAQADGDPNLPRPWTVGH